jgi:two-component system, sensor histidine kinase and response regulator
MTAKKIITKLIHTEERLRKISDTFISFSSDPSENITRLVSLLGEILEANCCIYNKIEDHTLCATAYWNMPPGFQPRDDATGHICYDLLKDEKNDILLVRNLDKTSYHETDPGVRALKLKTYFGKIVIVDGRRIGSICTLFKTDYIPSTEDEEVLGIISSAISGQETLLMKIDEIRDREQKLQSLIDKSPKVAIQFYDIQGRLKYWNQASEGLYGYTHEETTGKSLNELIMNEESHQEFLQTLKHIDRTGETVSSEWTVIDKFRKEHYIMSTIFSVNSNGNQEHNKDFVCMDIDLSELKTAELKLKEYTKQLENLNATKDKFFSIIAHDLKNPFNTILGFSRLLFNEYNQLEDEEILKFIRTIRDSSENAFKLLQNLLMWSRIQTGKVDYSPEIISLSLITNETIALLRHQAIAKNVQIISDMDPALQAFADENMIKTVLRNLISNAIKYSHSGSKVEISVFEDRRMVTVAVADNGIGMDAILVKKLFKTDESTERPGTLNEQGTGLGLILCKEFLAQHNSEILVKSSPGEGSTFSFSLPKYKG